jgi:hypothetical protein
VSCQHNADDEQKFQALRQMPRVFREKRANPAAASLEIGVVTSGDYG